jgi:hypothetical protein
MEHDYRSLDAIIREAERQRSIALGKLLADLWSRVKRAAVRFQRELRAARRATWRFQEK